ncbi:MAG TPA: dihydrofolate reductase family protein [Solirubrobacteraceae bacterium]|jgi:dihydrofolate reductase|nr:dihydrofolate reductase family protein [Solirubrobacteraceae bacterium]
MGKLVVTEFVSLDGVFEDPGGAEGFEHGGWSFKFDRSTEGDTFKVDELTAAGAQLLGRVTYQGFAAAWPNVTSGPFAEKMNSMPKYVVSSTLERADWENSTVIDGDGAMERIAGLKQEVEGDILVAGSGTLVTGLAEAGLVDELHLMVFPIVLGTGRRLFDGLSSPATLQLAGMQEAGDALILTYVPR